MIKPRKQKNHKIGEQAAFVWNYLLMFMFYLGIRDLRQETQNNVNSGRTKTFETEHVLMSLVEQIDLKLKQNWFDLILEVVSVNTKEENFSFNSSSICLY